MVAYSFKKQFGPPILAGTKAQTIRAERAGRSRHVRQEAAPGVPSCRAELPYPAPERLVWIVRCRRCGKCGRWARERI